MYRFVTLEPLSLDTQAPYYLPSSGENTTDHRYYDLQQRIEFVLPPELAKDFGDSLEASLTVIQRHGVNKPESSPEDFDDVLMNPTELTCLRLTGGPSSRLSFRTPRLISQTMDVQLQLTHGMSTPVSFDYQIQFYLPALEYITVSGFSNLYPAGKLRDHIHL